MQIHVEVAPQALWHIGPVPITNTMFMMFLVMGILLIGGWLLARSLKLVPGKVQSVVELIVEFMLSLVEGTAGATLGREIFPLIGGLFIFLLFGNYIELLPGLGTVGLVHHVEGSRELIPLVRPPTSDLNMTLAMAIISYIMFQYLGIRAHGVRGRIKHLATPFFVFPIEVISEFARIISLSFRLFGNIFAGDVLLTIMYAIANAIKISLIGLFIPVVFLYLEVLFGFIQALVFAILTLIYITLATADSHEEHAEATGEAELHGAQAAAHGGD